MASLKNRPAPFVSVGIVCALRGLAVDIGVSPDPLPAAVSGIRTVSGVRDCRRVAPRPQTVRFRCDLPFPEGGPEVGPGGDRTETLGVFTALPRVGQRHRLLLAFADLVFWRGLEE